MPLDGVVSGLWRDAVLETDAQGRQRINRITYDICVLQALREKLRCKEVWVVGANRYSNPDEDLPADFEVERAPYYAALNLPVEADRFIEGIKAEMRTELATLDAGLPSNADVRLTERRGKSWITLTPLDAQPDPNNIARIKAELQSKWSMTGLLDMVKESDLRLGITDAFKSPTVYELLDRSALRPRLLLCLHGLGTNAGATSHGMPRFRGNHQGSGVCPPSLYQRAGAAPGDRCRGQRHAGRAQSFNLARRHKCMRVGLQALRRLGSEPDDAMARSLRRSRCHDLLACRAKIAVHPFAAEITIVIGGRLDDRRGPAPLHGDGG